VGVGLGVEVAVAVGVDVGVDVGVGVFLHEFSFASGAPSVTGCAKNVETFFFFLEKARVTNVVATPLWGVMLWVRAPRPKRRTAPWLQGPTDHKMPFGKAGSSCFHSVVRESQHRSEDS
jgi:hypothetical protein